MRRLMSLGLVAILAVAGLPSAALAGAQSAGTVTGVARGGHMQPLTGVRVQLRSAGTGQVIGTTVSTDGGAFSFSGLPPGDYLAEVIDAAGKVQGVGAPVSVTTGGTAATSVIALNYGTSSASSGGFSLFGMGPATSLTVLGAAAAASVTAVVATRPDASPSR
jgi:hypothetical protein